MSPDDVKDNEIDRRFELRIGDEMAVTYYTIENDRIVLRHTEVPHHLSGRGIGTTLAQGVFAEVGRSGRRAIALCPFMAAYAARHPEAMALIDG